MNLTLDIDRFRGALGEFTPGQYNQERLLSLFSAALAIADDSLTTEAIRLGATHSVTGQQFYEIVLQSYLFLGFPRMLMAAECLHEDDPQFRSQVDHTFPSTTEMKTWQGRGEELCRQVYGNSYDALKNRVSGFAPEIFDWMILEGYGKVLSRPNLNPVIRELSVVAFLMVENRPRQLYSHMRGVLHVGGTVEQLTAVIEEIGASAGDGYATAQSLLARLGETR